MIYKLRSMRGSSDDVECEISVSGTVDRLCPTDPFRIYITTEYAPKSLDGRVKPDADFSKIGMGSKTEYLLVVRSLSEILERRIKNFQGLSSLEWLLTEYKENEAVLIAEVNKYDPR